MAIYRDNEHKVQVAKLIGTDLNVMCRLCHQVVTKENSFKIQTRFLESNKVQENNKYYHVSCFITWILGLRLKRDDLNDFFKGFMKGHTIGLRASKHDRKKP